MNTGLRVMSQRHFILFKSISMPSLFFYLIVGSLLLTGCESSFNLSTAPLSDPAMSTAVDLQTRAPLEKATIFPADVKTLYATVGLKGVPADTSVEAVFSYLEGQRLQVARETGTAAGGRYLSFSFNPPAGGWPVGRYEVEFFLKGEAKEKIGFSIVPATDGQVSQGFPASRDQQTAAPASPQPDPAPTAPAVTSPSDTGAVAEPPVTSPPPPAQGEQPPVSLQPGVTYKKFQDKQFGFSFELPENWTFQIIGENSDYLFSGPANSPESEISVIVQVIDSRKGVVNNLKDQMLSLLNQFSQMAGARIETKSEIQTAGQTAPFFLATYPADNIQKQKVTFGHTQLGLDHPPYLILVRYLAPREIYQQNVSTFQHMMDSMKLTPPAR